MNRDLKHIFWQGGLTSVGILIWTAVTAIPWVASRMPAPDLSFIGAVGILSLWVVWGAIAGIWATSWWIYLLESAVLFVGLIFVAMSLLLFFHGPMMEAAGPAAMGLMLPFVFAAFAFPLGGVIRVVLKAASLRAR